MDVALVRWPSEEDARDMLARRGRPRLLLVEDGIDPPMPGDVLEDWIRVPAPERDVAVRVETLRRRLAEDRPSGPSIDDDGVVRVGDDWTTLPPVEARLMTTLIDGYRSVVSRRDLARAGWPGGDPGATRSTYTSCGCGAASNRSACRSAPCAAAATCST
ncbi:MAG: hypothetical protein R2699_00030 [Acidimicrobiales bacterium]